MALFLPSSLFFSKTLKPSICSSSKTTAPLFIFFNKPSKPLLFTSKTSTFKCFSSVSEPAPGSDSPPDPDPNPNPDSNAVGITDESGEPVDPEPEYTDSKPVGVTDEWGEPVDPEPGYPTVKDSDPPKDDDEWEEEYGNGNTRGIVVEKDDGLDNLKRCLVDTVYGSNFGFRADPETRGEVLELVNQLEALNPTPAPLEATSLLDGNWVLLYTAFSELLPLLTVGSLPLLKVEKITQSVDTATLTIVNSTALSSPFATFSFSASAAFEARSSSRIQVEFKEGTLQPPEIKSRVDLPQDVNIFGQNVNLSPVQQSLQPLQEFVANISRTIFGQSPLKLPIPGDRSRSWLLITYLDEDFRISRGDGGLFVLVKEGSPLLDQ